MNLENPALDNELISKTKSFIVTVKRVLLKRPNHSQSIHHKNHGLD